MSDDALTEIARAICRVQLNGGDPNQPAMRWNGPEAEPQEFPAWRDFLDEARHAYDVGASLIKREAERAAFEKVARFIETRFELGISRHEMAQALRSLLGQETTP